MTDDLRFKCYSCGTDLKTHIVKEMKRDSEGDREIDVRKYLPQNAYFITLLNPEIIKGLGKISLEAILKEHTDEFKQLVQKKVETEGFRKRLLEQETNALKGVFEEKIKRLDYISDLLIKRDFSQPYEVDIATCGYPAIDATCAEKLIAAAEYVKEKKYVVDDGNKQVLVANINLNLQQTMNVLKFYFDNFSREIAPLNLDTITKLCFKITHFQEIIK